MYKKKQDTKPQVISYERVKSYMLWMIERYGDYSARTLLQKANLLFRDDTQYNEAALAYLIERDIVNDLRYAKRLTMSFSEKNIGPNKIKEKLYAKGFSSQTINECVSNLATTDEDYFEKALILKKRKFGDEPIEDLKLKQKALRHIISKGFSYSIANQVIGYTDDEC
ncbi:regulatory protein RecX [Cognaticolwellia beringensis]|uniref:Regulatory protein RecX n=1 Tax=Cognaticolwellia beringensis TaxID=1967665 RepID=A0A222GA08_9GAMM|nr:regulatory protein RecX [Cognaticolwellia beringensis]ASP48716.1 RecX family transcriptional regulator [Cognaticolwellia beringensis]